MNRILVPAFLVLATSFTVSATTKVFYGDDDREEVASYANKKFREYARSTAAMIGKDKISYEYNGLLARLYHSELGQNGYGVCQDEAYTSQTTTADCSGFLVGEDLLVTAGHCVSGDDGCSGTSWVFDYRQDLLGSLGYVDGNDIYNCKEIVGFQLDNRVDYAVIKLDRKVKGRTPLKYRTEGEVSVGDKVLVIGHPTGLPTKIADNARVRDISDSAYFSATLDTFGGNSGSAVFNAETGLVEGILVRGEQDYEFDPENGCYRPFKCAEDECMGEEVTRITIVPQLNNSADDKLDLDSIAPIARPDSETPILKK